MSFIPTICGSETSSPASVMCVEGSCKQTEQITENDHVNSSMCLSKAEKTVLQSALYIFTYSGAVSLVRMSPFISTFFPLQIHPVGKATFFHI